MKFLPFLLLAFLAGLPAHSQTRLVLENSRTGRQKEIKPGSRVRLRFDTRYEGLKVRQQGRVLSLTDSTLTFVVSLRKDTVTVALAQITGIGKYNGVGAVALGLGAGAVGAIALRLTERGPEGEEARPGTTLLALLGVTVLASSLDALVYPVRKVNSAHASWRLQTAR
ncbi:MAG: hypothetical protein ICV83_22245 [Cytophagales bacterium]|nr:hypothetical protein [Cytophagales bacterium]